MPDHLDRHHDFDAYAQAKLRVFANQGPEDVAVLDESDPALADRSIGGGAQRLAVADGEPLVKASELKLLGPHNRRNAAAAAAASLAMGIDEEAVRHGLSTFAGIPHRLELVAEIDGAIYVNDSKATNVAAAAAALRSFEGPARAILGGSLKGGGFAGLVEPVRERCAACYLIGEAADAIERDLASAREAGVELQRYRDLEHAVTAASADARRGEVVLLAPACASFDAYRDFEERGEHFRSLVERLAAGA
jgi:UDP-N-acetylmuramoylalanine--D-glutamate ligase